MVESISKVVQDLIDEDLSLQYALERGYGNYSAIARMLKPRVEDILKRKVKLESIITSVKRARVSYRLPQRGEIAEVIANSVINLRTDVAKISVEKTRETLKTIRRTLTNFPPEEFLQILEGMDTITIVFDQKLFEKIRSVLPEKNILEEKKDLAAIIIKSPKKIINTPGCIASFYNAISRRHINIEETMSCSTETIIVLCMEDVGKAFTTITNLVTEARKLT